MKGGAASALLLALLPAEPPNDLVAAMFLAAITPVLLLAAFILLLLVTLSAPIIKSIYLFKLVAHVAGPFGSSVKGNAKFGIWGYCFSGVDAS